MPGDTRSRFEAFLNTLIDRGKDFLSSQIPKCNVCGESAAPVPCEVCEGYACIEHGWFNKQMRCICGKCVAEMLEEELEELYPDLQDEPEVADDDEEGEGDLEWAEDVLDLKPPYSKEDVNKAFRKAALDVHPDHGGTNEAFTALQRAKRIALGGAES